jgi:hypothetical protein
MSTSITAIATPPAKPPTTWPMGIEEEEEGAFPEICTPDVAELELETRVTVTTLTEETGPADGRGAIW